MKSVVKVDCRKMSNSTRGSIQAVFDIGIPILGTVIWVCLNLILSETETTIKHNSSFLSNQQHDVNIIA